MRIGELARRSGVSTRSLRHYEEKGLLVSRRSTNGYRDYDETHVRLVQEIRALMAVGFTLEDARPFVACLQAGNESGGVCPESVEVVRRKLIEIDTEIRDLMARRDEMLRRNT